MFGIFNELLSTQNVNVARFARNSEWDFFYDFQTLWFCVIFQICFSAFWTRTSRMRWDEICTSWSQIGIGKHCQKIHTFAIGKDWRTIGDRSQSCNFLSQKWHLYQAWKKILKLWIYFGNMSKVAKNKICIKYFFKMWNYFLEGKKSWIDVWSS